jgi:2-C-methyl-D-erythritol 4-phosphate cytidylyltransferase
MQTAAIVVAAGMGVRMGAPEPKALLPLAGRPMLAWSLEALARSEGVDAVIVAAPPGRERDVEAVAAGTGAPVVAVVAGGATRSRSVARGLAAAGGARRVLVHDAARPLLTPGIVASVVSALDGVDGAIAAAPLADTLKRQGGSGLVAETVDRSGLWLAQTPQAFWREALEGAYARADAAALDAATDCSWLVERAGGRVRLVDPGVPNLKVTTPSDLPAAEALLRAAVASRAG